MIPAQVENWVAGRLDELRKIGHHQAHLCIHQNKIGIFNKDHDQEVHPILFVFNAEHITHGLSSGERSNVTKIILEYAGRHKLWESHK